LAAHADKALARPNASPRRAKCVSFDHAGAWSEARGLSFDKPNSFTTITFEKFFRYRSELYSLLNENARPYALISSNAALAVDIPTPFILDRKRSQNSAPIGASVDADPVAALLNLRHDGVAVNHYETMFLTV